MTLFKRFFLIFFIPVLWMFAVPVIANEDTSAGLVILDELSLNIPSFSITPSSINLGENLVFSTLGLTYSNGANAIGIACELRLQAPDNSAVILSSITNANGVCAYDTSLAFANQNVTLVSGDVSKLNNILGNGSGSVAFLYQNQTFLTNNATYTVVNPLSLNPLSLTVTPPQVYLGENLVFASNPITLSNNTTAVGIPCTLTIVTPNNSSVVLSGVTGSDGVFRFNTSLATNAQNLTLDSGVINTITNSVGNGTGVLSCTYNNVTTTSNNASYSVIPISQAVIPSFSINPERVLANESLVFAGGSLKLDNNTVLSNVPCALNITTPASTQLVLLSQTNASGICTFDPTIPLSTQGWNLVSGTISDIYTIGFGTAYIQYQYNSSTIQTNFDTYEVYEIIPEIDVSRISFQINPESALLGTQVGFTLQPVYFDNGDLAVGLVCRLHLIAPDNSTVTLVGTTSANGSCEFIAPDQRNGVVQSPSNMSVATGNPLKLNTVIGNGNGFAEIEYNGATNVSNIDIYNVFNQTDEETTPPETIPDQIINFITNTPRTGGMVVGAIGFLGLLAVFLLWRAVRTVTKK
jgi:hypothetical protein